MAQHRAQARRTHRVRNTMLGIGAFLGVMYAIGHNAQQEQAQATVPAPSTVQVQAPAPTYTVTLPGSTVARTVTLPAHTAEVTLPAPEVTATVTAAPATVTSTEYPDHATVTSTAPQQTITHIVRPDPATYAADPATLPHCAQEDGSGRSESCVWDANVDGNGQGTGMQVYTGADQ